MGRSAVLLPAPYGRSCRQYRSTVARVLGVLDLKAVAGWAATTFIVWWAIMNPADVGHLAANVAVFMSNAKAGVGAFVAST